MGEDLNNPGFALFMNYQDNNKNVQYYKKAAERNHAEAQYKLGQFYYHAKFEDIRTELFKKDTAKEWYIKAAKQGYEEAINALNNLYYMDLKAIREYKD